MRHLPLFASLAERDCLIVGGGGVAERRAKLLLEAGARVTALAPEFTAALEALAEREPRLELERAELGQGERSFEPYWLIVAATGDRGINAQVAAEAERMRRFCNVVDDPELCTFIMPAIVDRDPVTIAVSSGGASPVVSRWIKGLVETLVPQRIGSVARLAGRWRDRVRAALPDPDRRRHFWQEAVEGEPAEHCYAGRDAEADAALERHLEAWRRGERDARRGEAYLVGAGPGNPDLITLRGRQLLAAADVVLYDRLGAPGLLRYARRDAELIPVGKTPHAPSITQPQINRLLVERTAAGQRVCRLKGGDPMVFGRAGEELEALVEAGLPFQIVPGVSAVEGCSAYAGIPLTLRDVSRTVLLSTGHTNADGASELGSFRPGQTLALYMGVAQYGAISAELIERGHARGTPVAVIENGTTDAQRVIRTTLGLLPSAGERLAIQPPALLLIGETTRLAEKYGWFGPGRLEIFDDRAARELARVS